MNTMIYTTHKAPYSSHRVPFAAEGALCAEMVPYAGEGAIYAGEGALCVAEGRVHSQNMASEHLTSMFEKYPERSYVSSLSHLSR
ncbi:hypothetical protein CCP4SC76_800008 [Gammaproteobacteria bacterium]